MTALPRRIRRPLPRSGGILDGRYRLGQLLGAGGTADVFRAVDLRLRREVAVKIFRPGVPAVTAERFCQEAVLLGRLTHPALVTVHDVGWHESCTYVVMRLIRGVTLRQHIVDGPLTADRVARIGARLASALAHVHAAGIVHRDVKPSNVLIGPGDTPYLADFGISRLVDEPTRSSPGTIVGTVSYLAPEQILGHGSGPACDVHALGLVLLEALKGGREYPGSSLDAALDRSRRAPYIPSHVPGELAATIEAMTRVDPATRPDAAECARLLDAAAASCAPASGPPVVAAPATSDTQVLRRRRRRLPTAGLVAGIILGASGATLAVLHHQAGPDADNSRPAPTTAPLPPLTQPTPPPVVPPPTTATPPPATATLPPSTPPTRATTPPPPPATTVTVAVTVPAQAPSSAADAPPPDREPRGDTKPKGEKRTKPTEPPGKPNR
ncbi:serine/threonine-protein kinase [Embleya sp. MST-111070]|uniref:serine/threonine-protein kinase n=1 Tax=Embleya sp. MST-111070 TaxID=3398231 RepID=UPI003F739FA5